MLLSNFVQILILDVAEKYFKFRETKEFRFIPKTIKEYLNFSINLIDNLKQINTSKGSNQEINLIKINHKNNEKFLIKI